MNTPLTLFFPILFLKSTLCTIKLQEQFSWSVLDYEYTDDIERTKAIATKRFVPENNLPVGIEVWNEKLFVTVPRWRVGVPSTLNYIPLDQAKGAKSPLLIPYPNWDFNEFGNCENGLTTVYRIKADACDRLWVLDTGTFGIGNTTQNPCPYALNIFDLTTNKRLRRYELRPEDTNPNTFIANIAVDLGRTCEDAFAYLSDELGYGLIVYSWEENKSWRFTHGFFMPDPLAGDFNIGGLNFQWDTEGVFGLALSPLLATGERVLYFSPLASNREFAVSTRVLRNSSKVGDSYHDFVALAERGPDSHVTAKVMSEDGVQLFNLIDRNAIGCWNSRTSYEPANIGIVDFDETELLFPSDIKIDRYGYVWVMSDRMSNFLLSQLDFNDVNFRIFVAPFGVLVSGTVCDAKTAQFVI
ncbi:yellow-y precursor [Tribolium castaneum]|uniref:Protein yellow n=1 Tax=Tribolium castaneum TaxID=7070 RepID=D1LZK9_TRICA|nr:yellow-y precursor [Tribolium castaneum]ACY71063.1 yellow-y [Tribolium castaneum]EEZ98347.1 Protein yellow-like Protein [Tribolium castaneum]|eukprot:NP_001161919.1 yellow-y precursor [Tribolium castaneum]